MELFIARVSLLRVFFAIIFSSLFLDLTLNSYAFADFEEVVTNNLSFTATSRTRYEHENWYGNETQKRNYSFPSEKVKLGAILNLDEFKLGLEGQYYGIWSLDENSSGPASSFYGINSQDSSPYAYSLRKAYVSNEVKDSYLISLGRQEYNSGSEGSIKDKNLLWLRDNRIAQRLIGSTEFTAGRSFDGAKGQVYLDENSLVTLFASHPTQGGAFVDANKEISKIDIVSLSLTNLLKLDAKEIGQSQLFYYYYGDRRGLIKTDNRPEETRNLDLTNINLHTVGGHLIYEIPVNENMIDTVLWGAAQTGSWGKDSHYAWAGVAEIGYKMTSISWMPWLRSGINITSGDNSTTDSKHGTFSQLIPTPRNYALSPFYNMQNLNDIFSELLLEPSDKIMLRMGIHSLSLTSEKDLLYSGGGAATTNSFGFSGLSSNNHKSVAEIADVGLTYKISEHIKISSYLAHAWGQSVLKSDFDKGSSNLTYALTDFLLNF